MPTRSSSAEYTSAICPLKLTCGEDVVFRRRSCFQSVHGRTLWLTSTDVLGSTRDKVYNPLMRTMPHSVSPPQTCSYITHLPSARDLHSGSPSLRDESHGSASGLDLVFHSPDTADHAPMRGTYTLRHGSAKANVSQDSAESASASLHRGPRQLSRKKAVSLAPTESVNAYHSGRG